MTAEQFLANPIIEHPNNWIVPVCDECKGLLPIDSGVTIKGATPITFSLFDSDPTRSRVACFRTKAECDLGAEKRGWRVEGDYYLCPQCVIKLMVVVIPL
jgi:hypothetical protein